MNTPHFFRDWIELARGGCYPVPDLVALVFVYFNELLRSHLLRRFVPDGALS
jgi:hypothetical protein